MKNRLIALIKRVSTRAYVRFLKQEPDLLAWVIEQSSMLPPDAELNERVYVALHGPSESFCKYGNHKKFNTIDLGYRFCGKWCQCDRENQSAKIAEHHASSSEEERSSAREKMKRTLRTKYGVENASEIPGVQEKISATNMIRYGVAVAATSDLVKKKIAATNTEKYGGISPFSSAQVQEKVKQTNMERYGATDTMHIARAAYAEQTGVEHPFLLPEMREKAKATMLARYGVENALQNPEILAEMHRKMTEKWGNPYATMVPEIRAKIAATILERYGRASPHQARYSDEAYAALQDGDTLRNYFTEGRSLREVARHLDLDYNVLRRACAKHGIELSQSSYEDAIVEYLRSYDLDVRRNDRMIIKPKELDIVLPEFRLAIEFCGIYWHGETRRTDPSYHLEKWQQTQDQGYRLITIFEDEWLEKRDIIELHLMSILGFRTEGPQNLGIRKISNRQASTFLKRHHIQGASTGFAHYGAFDAGTLVAAMSFAREKSVKGKRGGAVELLRFATDGRHYPGAAQALFAAFVHDHDPAEIVSYVDRRWFNGDLQDELGFQIVGETEPVFWYVEPQTISRHHRLAFREDVETMRQHGYDRIWDCGQLRYLWRKAN